jgi:glycosyltransferase involved in cell wall biosynthesis
MALDAIQRGANATLGRCVRLASSVVTLNPAVAEWVTATWGVDASVLPVGSPPIPRSSDRTAARTRFGLPHDRFLVLFVGRDVPKKGLDHVLGARDPAYDLVVVTDRPADGDRRATFVPFLPHDAFRDLIGAVDAFVLPSVGEGFPIVLQEAFGVGLPVVTTLGPGYEEFLGPEDALFIEPRSEDIRAQLLRLVAEPTLCRALSERSLAVAGRAFGLEPFLQAYERLYEALGSGPRSAEGREAA